MRALVRPTPGPAAAPAGSQAFPALFDAEFAYVWATLRRLGVRGADLEDVTHDVFVRVYRCYGDRDPSRPVRPWLFAFAYRVASDYRRLARNSRELLAERDEESSRRIAVATSEPADDALVRMEGEALIHAALDALDPEKRAVFILHELDECPVPDVARALEIPLNTAYTRLRLARVGFAAAVKRLRAKRGER